METTPNIGVLALQGAFEVHARRLSELGARTRLVRKPEDIEGLDGLVIPGGESSTFLKNLERVGFYDVLDTFVRNKPVFGTCAGCILIAREVRNPAQASFGVLDATVERNFYGRQNDSMILNSDTTLPGGPLEMVFIRAPRIAEIGPNVETLASRAGDPVLVRQGRILAATFHPELTQDLRVHQLFLDIVIEEKAKTAP
ncbi:pyridoxal phosphate synthase yaaE subunit [Bryocella elongata]|uniref:Pyridoxal 5'-phosphate synthase subunit PdxT n=1 Tax=Bryocella elongata TaxID=863522 RepID=A0A1H5ZNY7_9BACT|nr:pyridoxal 5'-phosphate synthase glutaminase subunit PdxT [Bryocella elongata]SEG37921.1 pyridoxal phosphate synthase yaaE subunit [Bryocella elongata]